MKMRIKKTPNNNKIIINEWMTIWKIKFWKPSTFVYERLKDTWIMWCAKHLPAKRKTVTLIKEFP